ncbi:MAG: sialidase [Gammaproteobacteria bacterium]|nr:sialidase [Rhodocyclaceae bacterium]MBU3909880.1 sialidase [Gammaproteobacteria bacterium]MBU3988870.1 sialidase [Gammaproteobacteria bacterium]MBU4003541.1 sialidase [Gammaproteobacteria bacterium]MBU4020100.1 sialidase [Gammaproteobacteria bacterium]
MNRVIGLGFAIFVALAASFAFSARKLPPMPLTETHIGKALLLDTQRTGQRLVTVGEHGYIFVSDNEGDLWRLTPTATDATLTSVAFADVQLGLAVGHDATILRSVDGGSSWQKVFSDVEQLRPLLRVMFIDKQRAIAVGAYGAYFESMDGGATWTERKISEEDRHFNALTRLTDGTLLLAGEAGTLLRSGDDGAQWEKLASPYTGSFFGLLPLAQGGVLAFGMRGNIFRSDDRGASWQAATADSENALFGGLTNDSGLVVLVGQNGTVLVSRDDGRTFKRVATQASRALSSVQRPLQQAVEKNGGDTILVFGDGGPTRIVLPPGSRP